VTAHVGDSALDAPLKTGESAAVALEVMRPLRLERVSRVLTVGLLGGLAFLIGHATPQDAGSERSAASAVAMNEAWAAAEQAQAFSEAHQPAVALGYAQRAYDLSADPTLLLQVAELEREVGNAARATHAFEQFLAKSGDRVPERRKLLARRQLQAAAAGTARLAVQTNVLGASVELEPERGVAAVSGFVVSVLLDAGERRLNFSKPGYETRTLQLKLEPGETRELRVDLDKADGGRSETGSNKPRWTLLR
jgi:hypothetical protein